MSQHQRIQFVDLMRGLAVIIMVMGHSIDSVLSVEARATEWFRLYTIARGFTAPVFLFVSGLAFAIATQKRWGAYLTAGVESGKRLLKIGLLFVVGYALHFPYFSLNKTIRHATPEEYATFFQVDILQCVAMSLLLIYVIMLLTRDPRRFAYACLVVGLGIVFATPFIWRVDFTPVFGSLLSPYFNEMQPSLFPLFPFAGFLLCGVTAGHFFLAAREKGRESDFFVMLFWGSVVMIALALAAGLLPVSIYPDHDYWKVNPAFFFMRLGIVILLTTGFYFIRSFPERASVHVIRLGQASLLVYVAHMVVVYGSAANSGLAQIVGRALTYHEALGVALTVLLAMAILSHFWTTLRKRYTVHSQVLQVAVAGVLMFIFFTNRY